MYQIVSTFALAIDKLASNSVQKPTFKTFRTIKKTFLNYEY